MPPSEDAWDKLKTQMDNGSQKSKKTFWWVGIAASFILGLLLSGIFFSGYFMPEKEKLVRGDERAPAIKKISSDGIKPRLIPLKKNTFSPPSLRKNSASGKSVKHIFKDGSKLTHGGSIPAEKKQETKTIEIEAQQPLAKSEPAKILPEKSTKSEDLKTSIAEIVEKAKAKNAVREVTDREIEQLLTEAQFKIRAEKALKDSKNTVNADVLLQEVEMEMDKSLKERVFDAIKNGLHQARTMLANRGR